MYSDLPLGATVVIRIRHDVEEQIRIMLTGSSTLPS